jgi:hypothetical protein
VIYRVVWLQTALDELTTLWMQADASQRQPLTSASHAVDQKLARDPLHEGESRLGDRRIPCQSLKSVASHSFLDKNAGNSSESGVSPRIILLAAPTTFK